MAFQKVSVISLLCIILSCLSHSTLAQISKVNISGTVTDGKDLLPGATVTLKGTKYITITDIDGKFTLSNVVAGKYTLVITYLGYTEFTKDIDANADMNLTSLTLKSDQVLIDQVEVTGTLQRDAKAINMVKTADNVVNVISSETIAKLPDNNAAETVQRLPGAAVQRDKGEGSFIALRGTPVDWTATLMNGDRLPVADEDNVTRSFEFEVLPSDLIDYVVVSKSVTPDIEGDNIGGSINFLTKTGVEKKTLSLNVGGGYSFLAQKPVVNATILWGNRSKNKRFSYVANVSYYGRYYAADVYRLYYSNNFNHGINRLELRDYEGMRHTLGVNFGAEYQVSENAKIKATLFYAGMQDNKYQLKTMYNWSEGSGSYIRLQHLHGKLQRQLISGQVVGEFNLGRKVKLTTKLATYDNRFQYGPVPYGRGDARNGYLAIEFGHFLSGGEKYLDQDYIDLYGNPIDVSQGTQNAFLTKLIGNDNPYGKGDPYDNVQPQLNFEPDPNTFYFTRAFSQLNDTHEKDPIVGSFDLTYSINNHIKLQFGAKGRYKEGYRNISIYQWLQNPLVYPGNIPMTNYATQPFDEKGGFLSALDEPYKGTFMPFITRDQHATFLQQLGDTLRGIPMDSLNYEYQNWAGSSYEYNETVVAGYAMAEFQIGKKVSLVGGLRLEQTILNEYADTTARNYSIYQVDSVTSILYYAPIQQETKNRYLSWLPALNLTYAINTKMNLRSAITRTLHRPNFAQTKPGTPVNSFENFEFNFGNPNLKPTYSYNFDLMYEYFWGNKGMFSIGGYYKYVTDHIFATITNDFDPTSGIIYKNYQNANKSFVVGTEVSITRKFDFLPRWAGGFGINANFTYSYSQMQVPGRPKKQAMPEQTPILYNVAIFYEKYGLNARIALNYTGSFLHELNLAAVENNGTFELLHKDTDFDLFHWREYMMDALVSYDFKKHYTVYIELNNLLNAPGVIYRGVRERPFITEYYGIRGQVGFKFTL
ncbi:MAG: TonB-dependent receptor [Chitinophagales bacterium]|nr:TonB-dependent receptor [Chitinophagales bacterium]